LAKAVVAVFKPQNFGSFKLEKLAKKFVNDEDDQVKLTMACCFHEIATMLSNTAYKYLSESLTTLLNSDDELVLHAIYKNLREVLLCFNMESDSFAEPNPKKVYFVQVFHLLFQRLLLWK
jgi:hypothetical protein